MKPISLKVSKHRDKTYWYLYTDSLDGISYLDTLIMFKNTVCIPIVAEIVKVV